MERREKMKGTVTPLSSVVPPEQARKAAMKVAEAIADKESELNHLNRFVADNNNLISLVKRLPDELHHDIMVPFGKAAFFPGRLIHTNELLVLLGEGYHAERTSKQTVDILKRRGKTLDSQVDAFNGIIQNLRLEESFFNSTAAEGEEGLVEIREEYFEEDPQENTLKTGLRKPDKHSGFRPQSMTNVAGDDEEDTRVEARIDEHKRNEDDKEFAKMMARLDELEREEEEDEKEGAAAGGDGDDSDDEKLAQRIKGLNNWVSEDEDQLCNNQEKVAEKIKMMSLGLQSSLKGELPSKKDLLPSVKERSAETHPVASEVNKGIQTAPKPNQKVSTKTSNSDAGSVVSRPITDTLKAFSGSIIEHSDNLPTIPNQTTPSQLSSTQPSKPVSRFKMQRR